jgi:hypothetical protein
MTPIVSRAFAPETEGTHFSPRRSIHRFTGFSLALATILAGGAAAGIALGSSSPAGAATRGPSAPLATTFSIAGELNGVAATSASNAWAVGAGPGGTLILHWNGTAWKQVPTPGTGELTVAAPPGGLAWAVGYTGRKTLILRWNGTTWS